MRPETVSMIRIAIGYVPVFANTDVCMTKLNGLADMVQKEGPVWSVRVIVTVASAGFIVIVGRGKDIAAEPTM